MALVTGANRGIAAQLAAQLARRSPAARIVNVSSGAGQLDDMGPGRTAYGPTGGFFRDREPIPW